MRRIGVWVVCAAVVAGCSSQKEAAPGDGARAPAAAEETVELYDRMNAHLEAGETNAAIAMLREAMTDPAHEEQRPWLFRNILDVLLSSGRTQAAREMLLPALTTDEAYARNAFGLIYRHTVDVADDAGRLSWTAELVDAGLSGRMRLYAHAWRLVTLYEVEGRDAAQRFLPACIAGFPDAEAKLILSGFLDRVIEEERLDDAEQFLDRIEELAGDETAARSMAVARRVRVLLARQAWDEAAARLRDAAPTLNDEDLAPVLQQFAAQATAEGRTPLAASLAEFVLENAKGKTRAREVAASVWMEAARTKGPATMVERLEALQAQGLSNEGMLRVYRASFYEVLNGKDSAQVERLLNVGDRLLAKLGPMDDEQGLRMLQLDASFLMEDYARAVHLLEQGIPGRDDAWREMALNKVKAHQALNEGLPEEAIERFRVFMAGVEEWENAEQDPATGVLHTREMTLGRNALRIGRIYASMGKEEEAAKAFEEAADYYTRAAATVAPDSESYALIKNEMDQIPSTK